MQIGIIKCVCVFFFLFQRFFVIVEKYLAREGHWIDRTQRVFYRNIKKKDQKSFDDTFTILLATCFLLGGTQCRQSGVSLFTVTQPLSPSVRKSFLPNKLLAFTIRFGLSFIQYQISKLREHEHHRPC